MITEDILEWISTLPKWQQKLSYAIVEKRHISEELLNEIYDIFKVEMQLESGIIDAEVESHSMLMVDSVPDVVWQGVGDLHGVNRLKSGSELSVSRGLTVVYGENGSGKSGYTRLLNNAFISRGDQDILPNIFLEHPEEISANFKFSVDGNLVEYKFPDKRGEYPFKTIRNFDSKSAADDMNRESAIDFAPSELSFFDILMSACAQIQQKLDEERETKKVDNPILKYFPKEGKALDAMKSLSEKTDIESIKKTFVVSKEEKDKYEDVKTEKANLIALDINKQIALIDQVIAFLNKAKKQYEIIELAICEENISIYNQQISFWIKCKLIHEKNGIALFEGDGIEQIGTEEWKEFISYAKKYYDCIEEHDKCPLCGQEIHENDLIFKYWKYLESDSENNYNVAKQTIQLSTQNLKELDVTFLVESSVQEQWLMENYRAETEAISNIFAELNLFREKVLSSLELQTEIVEKYIVKKPLFQDLIDKIIERKNGLKQDIVNARILECEKIENEYVDKTKVIELLPIIENYVKYLKWDSLAIKAKIKTRNITNKQKELFEKYVTEDYLKTFEEECKKLNAGFDIEIVSRGSSGQTLKKLQIKGTSPGKVLSEGEQRAISIANFLTEVHMDGRNVGIVLDDPVCSLDHKRRSYIVNRMLEEAKQRQVIIFTHEITFFMELKTEAERRNIDFTQETIRKMCNEPGDISHIIPWQGMTVKDRIGKLKNDLQAIVAVYNTGDMDTYYYRAKEWCELLRESWERAVEEILFNDAIQRYNPCVQTQRLRKAPFSHELYEELERGMTECSSWCHDQARAINGNVPNADELKRYIECFELYCKQYKAK